MREGTHVCHPDEHGDTLWNYDSAEVPETMNSARRRGCIAVAFYPWDKLRFGIARR